MKQGTSSVRNPGRNVLNNLPELRQQSTGDRGDNINNQQEIEEDEGEKEEMREKEEEMEEERNDEWKEKEEEMEEDKE